MTLFKKYLLGYYHCPQQYIMVTSIATSLAPPNFQMEIILLSKSVI